MTLKDSPIPESPCPECGHEMDRAMATPQNPDASPAAGDVSVCINCGALLQFDAQLRHVKLASFDDLDAETIDYLLSTRRAVLRVNRRH